MIISTLCCRKSSKIRAACFSAETRLKPAHREMLPFFRFCALVEKFTIDHLKKSRKNRKVHERVIKREFWNSSFRLVFLKFLDIIYCLICQCFMFINTVKMKYLSLIFKLRKTEALAGLPVVWMKWSPAPNPVYGAMYPMGCTGTQS